MKSGFTLIELLVAIAVFFILTSFVVVKYQGNNDLRYLRGDAQKIVDDLQKIQNMALTGELIGDFLPDSYELKFSACEADCEYVVFYSTINAQLKKIDHASLNFVGGFREAIVSFRSPRGRMFIYDDGGIELDDLAINIYNKEGSFCLKLNSVSGRIGLTPGQCP